MNPHKIVSCLNDVLEGESDGEPLEYSDDDYLLESSSSSSCDESEDTTQKYKQGN